MPTVGMFISAALGRAVDTRQASHQVHGKDARQDGFTPGAPAIRPFVPVDQGCLIWGACILIKPVDSEVPSKITQPQSKVQGVMAS